MHQGSSGEPPVRDGRPPAPTGGDAASTEPDRVRRGSIGRRRLLKNSAAVAGGLGAAAWVRPSMRSIGISNAYAISGGEALSATGNNGVGNGPDPQPPGNPPINDGLGTGAGNPGNKGGTPGNGGKKP